MTTIFKIMDIYLNINSYCDNETKYRLCLLDHNNYDNYYDNYLWDKFSPIIQNFYEKNYDAANYAFYDFHKKYYVYNNSHFYKMGWYKFENNKWTPKNNNMLDEFFDKLKKLKKN